FLYLRWPQSEVAFQTSFRSATSTILSTNTLDPYATGAPDVYAANSAARAFGVCAARPNRNSYATADGPACQAYSRTCGSSGSASSTSAKSSRTSRAIPSQHNSGITGA